MCLPPPAQNIISITNELERPTRARTTSLIVTAEGSALLLYVIVALCGYALRCHSAYVGTRYVGTRYFGTRYVGTRYVGTRTRDVGTRHVGTRSVARGPWRVLPDTRFGLGGA